MYYHCGLKGKYMIQKNSSLLTYFLLFTGVLLFSTACVKNNNPQPEPKPEDFFNYATVRSAKLTVDYQYPYQLNSYIEAYTQNPLNEDEYGNFIKKENLTPFASGYTDKNGKFSLETELPAVASQIYIYSPTLGAPTLVSYDLNGNKLEQPATAQTGTKATKPYYKNWQKQNLAFIHTFSYKANGAPEDLVASILDDKTVTGINATLTQGVQLDHKYFNSFREITLSEDSRVTLYHLFSKTGNRNNALAYYICSANEQPTQEYINKNLILLYPNLSEDILQPGDGVVLKNINGEQVSDIFPAGTKIGLVLLVDAWNGNSVNTSSVNAMYSDPRFNSYNIVTIMANRPQIVAFSTNGKFVISFEDQPWTENPNYPYPGDFKDNVFILHTDPPTALPDIEPGNDPEEPDYGMALNTKGVLSFEDNWPYKGDYDLNDLSVTYQITDYFDIFDVSYTAIEGTFTFANNGAQYSNGFGFELPTNRSNIKSAVVTSNYTCQGQGLDPDLENATIMLFDNGKEVPTGTTFKVKIVFNNPISSTSYKKAPYNPFITIDYFTEQNRKEVHLVNYAPTAKIDASLLGYGHDLSIPSKGIYYVSDAQYPFSIHINTTGLADDFTFALPKEGTAISQLYPAFNSWVTSKGEKDKDWYEHPAGN